MKGIIKVVTLNKDVSVVRLVGWDVLFTRVDSPNHLYKSKVRLDLDDRPYFISKGIRHYLYKQTIGSVDR